MTGQPVAELARRVGRPHVGRHDPPAAVEHDRVDAIGGDVDARTTRHAATLRGGRLQSDRGQRVEHRVQVLAGRAANRSYVGSDDGRAVLDERLLVEQARKDPNAFALLYRAYVNRIHAFAYRRTGSYDDAEEITAAVFERAWRALPGFSWRGGGFEPWLFRIASNELISHHRRRARVHNDRVAAVLRDMADDLRDDPDLAALLEVSDRDERVARVRAAVGTLTPRYQEVISLRYLAGMSADEAATALGCTKANLAVTLHRALRSLKKALAVEAQVGR